MQMVCNPHKEKLETTSLELDTINHIVTQPIHLMMYIRTGSSRLFSHGKGDTLPEQQTWRSYPCAAFEVGLSMETWVEGEEEVRKHKGLSHPESLQFSAFGCKTEDNQNPTPLENI